MQIRDFFGLRDAEIPKGLGEDELLALYRRHLKEQSGLPFVANLAVPHPKQIAPGSTLWSAATTPRCCASSGTWRARCAVGKPKPFEQGPHAQHWAE